MLKEHCWLPKVILLAGGSLGYEEGAGSCGYLVVAHISLGGWAQEGRGVGPPPPLLPLHLAHDESLEGPPPPLLHHLTHPPSPAHGLGGKQMRRRNQQEMWGQERDHRRTGNMRHFMMKSVENNEG